jgi:hypothetical protein
MQMRIVFGAVPNQTAVVKIEAEVLQIEPSASRKFSNRLCGCDPKSNCVTKRFDDVLDLLRHEHEILQQHTLFQSLEFEVETCSTSWTIDFIIGYTVPNAVFSIVAL